jgi:hypothetical protein
MALTLGIIGGALMGSGITFIALALYLSRALRW